MRMIDILYPAKCVFCGDILRGDERGSCSKCAVRLPYVQEPACSHCGKPIIDDKEDLCVDCRRHGDRSLDQSVALWQYRTDTQVAMRGFKYGGLSAGAEYFAEELVKSFRERVSLWAPDVVVPIPVHRSRERFRGYNQAGLLAEALGERLGLSVAPLLRRIRGTMPQKGLTPTERRRNLRQAFAIADGFDLGQDHPRVLLVDDIYTTGATLDVCARTLKEAGASAVFGMCLCIGGQG